MESKSSGIWSNPEFLIKVNEGIRDFIKTLHYKEYILSKTPKVITISIVDLLKYFNLNEYTELFFDSLKEEIGYSNFIVSFRNIINEFYQNKTYFVNVIKNDSFFGILPINDLQPKHFGRMFTLRCVIRNITERLSKIESYKLKCSACGEISYLNVTNDFIQENYITKRTCFVCKHSRHVIDEKVKNTIIRMKLETPTESTETNQKGSSIYSEMRGGLVNFFIDSNMNVGDRVMITGTLVDNPTIKNQTISQFFMKIHHIERDTDKEIFESLTKEHEEEILTEVKKPNFLDKLKRSIAPKIEGYDDAKTGLIIQELSGINKDIKVWEDPTIKKGYVHIIFAGDPATAKTQLVKFMLKVSPKVYMASGDQTTIAGLLGTVFQDPMMGNEWTLSAGALSLANKGTIIIDELNKLDSKEISRLNQVLSDYAVPFDKAKVNTTIYTEVKLLGIMNPQGDEWSKKGFNKQKIMELNLKKAFTTRITLIFAFFEDDLNNPDAIERALKRQQGIIVDEDVFDINFIKRFFIYAKRKDVVFDNETMIKKKMEFYHNIFIPRIKEKILDLGEGDDYEKPQIPSKMRIFDSFEAIVSGLARTNLTEEKICKPLDFHYEITNYLLENYYMSMFFKTHQTDWEKAGIDIKKITHSKKDEIFELVKFVGTQKPDGTYMYSYEEIWEQWKKINDNPNQVSFDDMLSKLKMGGDLIEPKSGYFQTI